MNNTTKRINIPQLLAAVLLIATFFLAWVKWNATSISGSDLPGGRFFKLSETDFGVPNPFPSITPLMAVCWLLPVAAAVVIVLSALKKNTLFPSLIAGAMGISLPIVYYLFCKQIAELGHSYSLQPWLYVHALAALVLIVLADKNKWLLKASVVLLTIAGTYFGFKLASKEGEKKVFDKTHESTSAIKADYTVSATDLIKEFLANDTAARSKYNEKILEVNGMVSEVKIAADSTSTIQFADSTGSYAIFSFEKTDMSRIQTIKAGDAVNVKGVCSGSMFSEILGTTSISFKRSVLNK